jgi:hypothetical protein
MLTRASKYLSIATATYHLDTEHITFTVAPAPGTTGSSVEFTADSILLSRIIGVSAFLNPPDYVYDIVTVLYQCVLAVRPVRGKPFFSTSLAYTGR